jgi:hypothetical protein
MAKINTEYDVGAAFEAIEEELISSMIRNMERHKVEEIEEDKQWSMWQAEQLKALEKYRKQNKKKFGKEFKEINKKIDRLILEANKDGQLDQEAEILKAIKKGFPAKKVSPGGTAEFFKVNDRKLNALLEATSSDMQKAENAVLRRANDQYRKAIFNAQMYANSGAGTYEKAVDMATKDFLSAGLNCIAYANGARHTLADYADMAIRTASKRAYLQGEGEKRQEWGLHLVIINKRGSPCPKCLPFVGKIMIDDVWSGGSRKDGKYPLLSSAIAAGLYHPRCRDSHTTYFPGITTVDPKYNRQELADIEDTAKQEARQQYVERQEKRFERLADYSLDPENQQRYQQKQKEWKQMVAEKETSGSIIEAQKKANDLGVKYALYDDLPLAMANEINDALETIPKDIRPAFVGDSATLEAYRGAKLPRKSNQFYGVHIDISPTGLCLGRNETTGRMNYDFDIQGQMIGISKKYNTAEKITKNKISEQKKYAEKHGNKWFFNEDGKSTPYHEIGHVYEDAKGLPDGFEKDATRWAAESGCDMLKNPKEAWAEAWGAYHTQNKELPEYIAKYIDQATEKPIAKPVDSGTMISGARITDIFSKEADEFAEMYYKEIRSFSTDAKKIAGNLNKKESDIRKIKSYLFEDKSLLDTDTGEWRRFDPDCAIAQSWQRLMIGKDIKPHDKTLIEHELLEMKIKKENPNMEHWKAHEIASEKYDYPKEATEYYGNLEKHKKNK